MSAMFLTAEEQALNIEFLEQGYVIRPVADRAALDWIRDQFAALAQEALGIKHLGSVEDFLNHIHTQVPVAQLNDFRLRMIRGINAAEELRLNYFKLARSYLEALVGNELAMQLRVNLSLQFPGDDSSLLPVHADTWSGDSPFEVVVWLPLVNCYGTKAMYLLPASEYSSFDRDFVRLQAGSSEEVYKSIENKVKWLEIDYGQVLVFNQSLPHGNRINAESETRWSMNCRFKSVFTPYGDKKLGEFFEPITLRAASRLGMDYRYPGDKK
ncbi:MAG TPA: sporadic carbohydrate cluster 2OG-Fe(II) oxygenase [Rhodocyclaceae bacterium]|nr:sporadic carbohydrate cluster 2OG-Fe(II) oxygenase [Rhodocyclaceae bacterium]